MDQTRARAVLDIGVDRIESKRGDWDRRQRYYDGDHDLPYAPEGVDNEYLALREQAVANWLQLTMDAPIQRLRAGGFRTGRDGDADETAWRDIWQSNQLDSRQRIPYQHMVIHGRGLMSVWPNRRNLRRPIVRTENGRRVHLEPDPEDPWTTAWAVKTLNIERPTTSRIILPAGVSAGGTLQVGMVYDADTWHRFERTGGQEPGGQVWQWVDGGDHDMGEVPIVAFDNRPDADAVPRSSIEPLIPAQNAINTIRFHTLLGMQFSAYRQRIVTAFDPVIRDAQGNPTWRTDGDGKVLTDSRGNRIPEVSTPGRVGVDRMLAFPGENTKVFDLPESNLKNYIEVLGEFLQDLFAVAQTPPQYLLNRMANLSGDALSAAESTLQSLVVDLQLAAGESLEQVMRLGHRARGGRDDDAAAEVIWADAEAKSFAQLVDGIAKLVKEPPLPIEAGLEMLPGATPQKVKRWMDMRQQEAQDAAALDPARALKDAADAFRAPGAAPGSPSPADDEGVDDPPVPRDAPTVPGPPVRRRPRPRAAARS